MAEKSKKSVNKQPRVEATKAAGTMMNGSVLPPR